VSDNITTNSGHGWNEDSALHPTCGPDWDTIEINCGDQLSAALVQVANENEALTNTERHEKIQIAQALIAWVVCWDLIDAVKHLNFKTDSLEVARIFFGWIDNHGSRNIDGIANRAQLVNARIQPHLRNTIPLRVLANMIGKKHKQSLGRFADDLYQKFPQLRPAKDE
jgi:hypothetical protein